MDKIQVFVIDNNSLFRQGLRQAIADIEDIELIGESELNDRALELVVDFSPEVVLLDIGMPLFTGLDLSRQITRHSPTISVVILTPYEDDEQLFQAVKSGAIGYLTKGATAEDIMSAVRRTHTVNIPLTRSSLTGPEWPRRS